MREPTIEQLRGVGSLKWSAQPGNIGAWVAEMDFGVAPPIAEALHRMVEDGLFGYLPDWLRAQTRAAVADFYASSYGWNIDPDAVRLMPDVIRGFEDCIMRFSAPGSKIVLPTPAYMPFLTVPGVYGRNIVEVPMIRQSEGWSLDLEGIDAAFADGGGLLVLCNPHNPIGKVYTRAEMQSISEIVERHGARVFSDEIHAPLIYPGATHIPYATVNPQTAAHTVTATSASKAWNLPGLKCGQLIFSNRADLERFDDQGVWAGHGTSTAGALASSVAYREGGPWLRDVRQYLETNRDLLSDLVAEHLRDIQLLPAEGTYLAWLDCRSLDLEDPAAFFSDQAGVHTTDGALCGRVGRGFIRLNFAMPRDILQQTVDQMAAALSGLAKRA